MARAVVLGLGDRRCQLAFGEGSAQCAAHFRAFCLAQRAEGGARAAEQLLQLAGLSLNLPAYGMAEARRLQLALDAQLGVHLVRLVVFEREHGCRVLWKGAQRAAFNLCLLLQQSAHFGYIQRPAQLFRAKQYCVECERPVDRRSHPLGCRAVCALCLRYDGLQFPCRRQVGEDQRQLHCAQCRFVFPNMDCFEAHRQRVDPPPPGTREALVDRRRGRPHRSMCEERRLCERCNVVVWARYGPHHCGRQQAATETAPAAAAALHADDLAQTNALGGPVEQQPQTQCKKCGGPHDPDTTPHFIQPKNYPRQLYWQQQQQQQQQTAADAMEHAPMTPMEQTGNNDNVAAAAATVSDDDDDNDDANDGEVLGANGRRAGGRNKPVRFIFWDVECAQERLTPDGRNVVVGGAGDVNCDNDADDDDDENGGGGGDDEPAPLLKHVPVLVCAEVICERCVVYGVQLETEPMRRAPGCVCGVPWRGANRRRWCARIGEEMFDDDDDDNDNAIVEQQQLQQQIPPDGLNPRRLRFFCDGEPGTGRGAMEQLVDFLLHTGPKGICTVMLAHNAGRYDIHLLLEELQRRGERPKKAIQHGLRVYMLELRGVHQRQLICKDSLNFLHCALAALPATFGLQGVPAKPFFPYHYIHQQNMDVVLPANVLPPRRAYDPDRMRPAQRELFMEWYERELHRPGRQPFVLRRELLRYCWNDVRILRVACLRLRELVGECAGGMEPFLAATTIASLAMAVFRQHHLPPNTMVQTPEGGFLRGRRASVASRRFFALLHALRPDLGALHTAQWAIGEACVEDDGFRLDCVAYRHPPLRPLCIEYNGCYAHGCRSCFPDRRMLLAGGRSAELLWARTEQRAWELRERHGMEVLAVWECEFKHMLRTNAHVRKLYSERCCAQVPGPLDLRQHALFGGRVEPFYLLYTCAPDEELVYIDIVSLYPYCMKTRSFPIGLPHVWTGDQLWSSGNTMTTTTTTTTSPPPALLPPPLPWCRAEDNPFTGFLFCRVLAPTACALGAHEPLLPYRTRADGRLIFGLCARCSELRQQGRCRHQERERAWTYAYTHVELNRALQLGYRVLDVYEVWHYDQWASPAHGNGLFTGYVNTFLRLKAESSGWPAGCDSEAARADYVRRYAEEHGVHLRADNVRHNPGLRQLAKDLLNALWGKMAERPERDNVQYTSTARAFHDLLADPRQEVVSFTHINEQMDRCVVRKREPFARAPEHNNLAVACFVTSHARLCLYEWLEEVRQVGGRAVYCDTDSVVYVKKRDAAGVREGSALGDMKREFPTRRIIDFFAAGPKNYGFMHVDARTGGDAKAERKVRSFELNYAASKLLQYERMRQLVINHFGRHQSAHTRQRSIAVPCHRFVRSRRADIFTRHSTRIYRPVYTKGRVIRTADEQPDMQPEQRYQRQPTTMHPGPMFFRTRPFGWYPSSEQEEEEDVEEEEEEDEGEQEQQEQQQQQQQMDAQCSTSPAVSVGFHQIQMNLLLLTTQSANTPSLLLLLLTHR